MSLRERMQPWVSQALAELGGEGRILDVAKHVWAHHENDLKQAGDAFYSWQYEMRWAADQLRKADKLAYHKVGSNSVWTLKQ